MKKIIKYFSLSIFCLTFNLYSTSLDEKYKAIEVKNDKTGHVMYRCPSDKPNKKPALIVIVENIKKIKGVIRVVLWQDRVLFTREDKVPFRYAFYPVTKENKNNFRFIFYDLPINKKIFLFIHHNISETGKLSYNIFGRPKEPYQFGNNCKKLFSKPTADEAAIEFKGETLFHKLVF